MTYLSLNSELGILSMLCHFLAAKESSLKCTYLLYLHMLSINVLNFLNFQQKVRLTVEEVVDVGVNQFFHYCNTFQHTHLEIQCGTMNTLSTRCADIKDIVNIFVVISACLRQILKGFTVKHSILTGKGTSISA